MPAPVEIDLDWMKEKMDFKRMSGSKLAGIIGVNPTTITRILNGKSKPSEETLDKIQTALGKSCSLQRQSHEEA